MKVSHRIGIPLIIVLALVLLISKLFSPVIRAYLDERSLLENGVPDTALVVRARPTGTIVNDQPMVRIMLERRVPDVVYRAEIRQVVPLVYVPRVQPGMRVPVLADANDRQRMVIDFERLDGMPVLAQ